MKVHSSYKKFRVAIEINVQIKCIYLNHNCLSKIQQIINKIMCFLLLILII